MCVKTTTLTQRNYKKKNDEHEGSKSTLKQSGELGTLSRL